MERAESGVVADSLSGLVPDDSPRYHLFCFNHTHEGDYQEATGKGAGGGWDEAVRGEGLVLDGCGEEGRMRRGGGTHSASGGV